MCDTASLGSGLDLKILWFETADIFFVVVVSADASKHSSVLVGIKYNTQLQMSTCGDWEILLQIRTKWFESPGGSCVLGLVLIISVEHSLYSQQAELLHVLRDQRKDQGWSLAKVLELGPERVRIWNQTSPIHTGDRWNFQSKGGQR